MSLPTLSKIEEFKKKLEAKRLGLVKQEQEPVKQEETPKQETAKSSETREAWLEKASASLRKTLLERFSINAPDFRVSVGFAKGAARQSRRLIGQCVTDSSGALQVFVSPVAEKSEDALLILLTQALSATSIKGAAGLTALALKAGLIVNEDTSKHGGAPFLADAFWSGFFEGTEETQGAYPHDAIKAHETKSRESAVKASCSKTGYKVRIAPSWIEKLGSPICPCCQKRMDVETK